MRKIMMFSAALVAAGCWALAASAGELGGSRNTSDASNLESAMGSASLSALQAMRSNDADFAPPGTGIAIGTALGANNGMSAMNSASGQQPGTETPNPPIRP